MPRIQSFEAPDTLTLHPSEVGEAAWRESAGVARQFANQSGAQLNQGAAAFGRGIANLGKGLGDLYDDASAHDDTLAQTEASKKSTDFELQQHDKLDHLMDPEPDPSDPSGQKMIQKDPNNVQGYTGKFLNDWWEQRQQLRSTITNDKALKQFDAETREQYRAISTKAYTKAGEVNTLAVQDNVIKATQSRAGIVFSDPTQLDAMLEKTHTDTGTLSQSVPSLSAQERERLRSEVDTKASQAIIERAIDGLSRTPEGRKKATEIINSGKYDAYIGEHRGQLLDHIRTMGNADLADQERQKRLDNEKQKETEDAATTEYIADHASGNPQKKLTDIWTDPRYKDPKARAEAARVIETMDKFNAGQVVVDAATSHKTAMDMMHRMALPDSDPNKLRDQREVMEAFGRTLNKEDFSFINSELARVNRDGSETIAKTREEFWKGYEKTLDPYSLAGGGHSALGAERIFKARQEAVKAEEDARARGEDPRTVYQPGNKNFFGNPENLQKYHTSQTDAEDYNQKVQDEIMEPMKKYAPQRAALQQPGQPMGGKPLDIAQHYLGLDENANHEALTAFLNRNAGVGGYLDPAQTAWCARFVNSVLATSGIKGSGSDAAKSFLKVGQPVEPASAQPGDIIVFNRGNDPAKGHVGFVKAVHGDTVEVLGGNQGNKVSVITRHLSEAVGVRRVGQAEVGGPVPGPLGTNGGQYATPTRPDPTRVVSVGGIEEARKLPAGTRFRTPDGRYGTVRYPTVPLSQ